MKRTPYVHIFILIAFLGNSLGPISTAKAEPIFGVEGEFHLPAPGILVHLSPPLEPPILKGIKVHPDNPFKFEFILDKGDENPERSEGSQKEQLRIEATKLIKYFLASLTIPENDLWVNLSPYEKDRIIPQSFGLTEMGRDLLAEDYMLKQITASLIYPEDAIGKKFWKRIYQEAVKKFGTTNIPVNTFNKVWIVPEKAVVYENAKAGTAYVVESKLKVMLEQDYLALSHSERSEESKGVNSLGSQIVREIVIPELTKEVNEDKNFAQLRQVYNSLILGTWYKKKIKDSILEQVYADKKKVVGVGYDKSVILSAAKDLKTPLDSSATPQNDTELIYQRYLQAFKKGVYNYIKEKQDPLTLETITRKYFSGGLALTWKDWSMSVVHVLPDAAMTESSKQVIVSANIGPVADQTMAVDWQEFTLPGGATMVLPKGLDEEELTEIEKLEKNLELSFSNSLGRLFLNNDPKGWDINDTPFSQLDERLEIMKMIEDIESRHKESGNLEPIVIVDWGCGDGTGLVGLQNELKIRGLNNVKLIGYSKDLYPQWKSVPQGIVFTTDISYIRKADFIFSHYGLGNIFYPYNPVEYGHDLLIKLKDVLGKSGVLRTYFIGEEDVQRQYLQEVFSVKLINKISKESQASYIEATYKEENDRAMATVPENLADRPEYKFKISGSPQEIPNNDQIIKMADEYEALFAVIAGRVEIIKRKKQQGVPIEQAEYNSNDEAIEQLRKHRTGQKKLADSISQIFERTISYHFILEGKYTTNVEWDLLNRVRLSDFLKRMDMEDFLKYQRQLENILVYFRYLQTTKRIFIIKAIVGNEVKEAIDPRPSLKGWRYGKADDAAMLGSRDFSLKKWYIAAHPNNLYHNYHHSLYVAKMAYDFARARGLSEAEALFLYQVGLLHDFDPNRPFNTRPRVPVTLKLLDEDFNGDGSLDGTGGKHSFLKDHLKWNKEKLLMAKAIIQRTEYPFGNEHPNPAYKGSSPLEEYKNILIELKRLNSDSVRFVINEAPLFSEYADKINWYATSESFDEMLTAIRKLYIEINQERVNEGKSGDLKPLTYEFMKKLGSPQSFVFDRQIAAQFGINLRTLSLDEVLNILPSSYKRRILSNMRGILALGGDEFDIPAIVDRGREAARNPAMVVRQDAAMFIGQDKIEEFLSWDMDQKNEYLKNREPDFFRSLERELIFMLQNEQESWVDEWRKGTEKEHTGLIQKLRDSIQLVRDTKGSASSTEKVANDNGRSVHVSPEDYFMGITQEELVGIFKFIVQLNEGEDVYTKLVSNLAAQRSYGDGFEDFFRLLNHAISPITHPVSNKEIGKIALEILRHHFQGEVFSDQTEFENAYQGFKKDLTEFVSSIKAGELNTDEINQKLLKIDRLLKINYLWFHNLDWNAFKQEYWNLTGLINIELVNKNYLVYPSLQFSDISFLTEVDPFIIYKISGKEYDQHSNVFGYHLNQISETKLVGQRSPWGHSLAREDYVVIFDDAILRLVHNKSAQLFLGDRDRMNQQLYNIIRALKRESALDISFENPENNFDLLSEMVFNHEAAHKLRQRQRAGSEQFPEYDRNREEAYAELMSLAESSNPWHVLAEIITFTLNLNEDYGWWILQQIPARGIKELPSHKYTPEEKLIIIKELADYLLIPAQKDLEPGIGISENILVRKARQLANFLDKQDRAMLANGGDRAMTDEINSGVLKLENHNISLVEKMEVLDGLFDKYGFYKVTGKKIPDSLKEKIIKHFNRSELLFFITGDIFLNTIMNLEKEPGLTPEEEDFLWPIFNYSEYEFSNRTYNFTDSEWLIDKMFERQKSISVLDVGSGPNGRSLISLKEKYRDRINAVGVDVDNQFDELEGVKLIKGNVKKMDFPDNAFDIVNESYLMVHFPRIEDFVVAIKGCMRVLKKDGVFIFNSETPYSRADILNGILKNLGYTVDIESQQGKFYIYKRDYQDPAMLGEKRGGIDLTPANMNLQTKVDSRDGEGIKFHLDPAMLRQLQNAQGFVPVIINIQPMKNLKQFLGITAGA